MFISNIIDKLKLKLSDYFDDTDSLDRADDFLLLFIFIGIFFVVLFGVISWFRLFGSPLN